MLALFAQQNVRVLCFCFDEGPNIKDLISGGITDLMEFLISTISLHFSFFFLPQIIKKKC